ncbi:hypothetical protein QCA50_012607 [Cerrena zonata]|uniref:Uncharacterized protein n=1 Tax=Cerrena zonata TaxID=2478898 RepID=A0AAW0FTA5_9APHY
MEGWDRFAKYASLVHAFSDKGACYGVWGLMEAVAGDGALFKNTEKLEWGFGCTSSIKQLNMFVSPALTELRVRLSPDISGGALRWLLEERRVRLDVLHAGWEGRDAEEGVEVALLLQACLGLRHLAVRSCSWKTLEIMSMMSNLVYLFLGVDEGDQDWIRIGKIEFRSLKEFGVYWEQSSALQCARRLLEAITGPCLKKISLHNGVFEENDDFRYLLEGVASRVGSIEEIQLTDADVLNENIGCGGESTVDVGMLGGALRMANLKQFRILGVATRLSKELLEQMARAWPLLEVIEINGGTLLGPETLFEPFAEHSLNLREIRIPWSICRKKQDAGTKIVRRNHRTVGIYVYRETISPWADALTTGEMVANCLCRYFVDPWIKPAECFQAAGDDLEKMMKILETTKAVHNDRDAADSTR